MIYPKRQIIQLLAQNGLLKASQVGEVFSLQAANNKPLSLVLTEDILINKQKLEGFIKSNCPVPEFDISQLTIRAETLSFVSEQNARKYRIFPLIKTENGILLAIANLSTVVDLEDIQEASGHKINPVVIAGAEMDKLLHHYYGVQLGDKPEEANMEMEDILGDSLSDISIKTRGEFDAQDLAQITQEMPIVKATNFIMDKAIDAKASDVLIEPLEGATRIRFRIDGVYRHIESLPRAFHPFIVSRIKVISDLDIAEHRFPQDGQFKIRRKDKEVDFRVSSYPTILGEKVAIRILDKSLGLLDLNKLGLTDAVISGLKKAAQLPHGMLLVCGPTGSGKTSTLYSLLKYVHTPEKNIITVEDPVEYQLKGINQVSINIKTGLNFSRCLRSILRQDPDIIMIGEIRDFETVDIAIKAALTGHLVLSTLHTTTAAGSVVRLLDMGVESFLINASLIAIVSQRLARRICVHCKEPVPSQPYFRGKGCKECMGTGYKGRILLAEVLHLTAVIKDAIVGKNIEEKVIKEIARKEGMRTLREEAQELARAGIITIEEVLRVTPAD
ncbi:MAG: GspE/PulE family protein [Candidatus Omnitrophica bacterium]|jgi:type IV pilus assembly protein PilB|nr:GspE/PulE family protein [Candidatus Omnitrophota bacterium]